MEGKNGARQSSLVLLFHGGLPVHRQALGSLCSPGSFLQESSIM